MTAAIEEICPNWCAERDERRPHQDRSHHYGPRSEIRSALGFDRLRRDLRMWLSQDFDEAVRIEFEAAGDDTLAKIVHLSLSTDDAASLVASLAYLLSEAAQP